MARKPKEFDPTMLLKIQKHQANNIINSNKDTKVANMRSSPYVKHEPYEDPFYDDIESYRGQEMYHFPEGGGQGEFMFPFAKIRGDQKVAHHMFTEPTRDQLIQEVISNPELNKSDYERILGPDYEKEIKEWKKKLNTGDQSLAWLRGSGSGNLTRQEFHDALKIINTSSPNEAVRKERETLLIKQAGMGV